MVGALSDTSRLVVFFVAAVVALAALAGPARAGESGACLIVSREDALARLAEPLKLYAKLNLNSGTSIVGSLADSVAFYEGCPRGIRKHLDKIIDDYRWYADNLTFPLTAAFCIVLTRRLDRLGAWLEAYNHMRGPHIKGSSYLPDVCVTGDLKVEYTNPCATPVQPFNSEQEAQLSDSMALGTIATAEPTPEPPPGPSGVDKGPPVTTTPGRVRSNRSALARTERSLVAKAADEIKAGRDPDMSALAKAGELIVDSELLDSEKDDTKEYPVKDDARYFAQMREQIDVYKHYFESAKDQSLEDRLDTIFSAVSRDYTSKYDSREAVPWNAAPSRAIGFQKGDGGNCTAGMKVNLAFEAGAIGNNLPPNKIVAALVWGDHTELVLYDKVANTIWRPEFGGQAVPFEKGDLYHPAIVFQADLKAHGLATLKDSELLIKHGPKPPDDKDKKSLELFASVQGTTDQAQRGLPHSEYAYGDGSAAPTFAVQGFTKHDASEARTNVAVTAGVGKLAAALTKSQATIDRVDEALARPDSVSVDARGADVARVNISWSRTNGLDVKFGDEATLASYQALAHGPDHGKTFLIGAALGEIKDDVARYRALKSGLAADPSKWTDKESLETATRALRRIHDDYSSLVTIADQNTLLAEAVAPLETLYQELAESRALLGQLADKRAELLLNGIQAAPRDANGRNAVLGFLAEIDQVPFGAADESIDVHVALTRALTKIDALRVGDRSADFKATNEGSRTAETKRQRLRLPTADEGNIALKPEPPTAPYALPGAHYVGTRGAGKSGPAHRFGAREAVEIVGSKSYNADEERAIAAMFDSVSLRDLVEWTKTGGRPAAETLLQFAQGRPDPLQTTVRNAVRTVVCARFKIDDFGTVGVLTRESFGKLCP